MSKFTKGAWKINRYNNGYPDAILPEKRSGYIIIAKLPAPNEPSYFSEEEKEANARLIAAAPIMYDLLKYAQELIDNNTGLYSYMSEVLERIDGEHETPKNSKLKPCPFCGGEAASYFIKPNYGRAYCTKCIAVTNDYATEEEAIEAWNRRINYNGGII